MSAGVKEAPRHRSTPLVDPRLQARRVEVARDQGRRRLRIVSVVVVLVLLVAGAVAASQSPLLDVDEIAVSGGTHTDAAAVAEAAGLSQGQAMISIDPGAAASGIERLPWVQRASVSRSWPGSVRITVVERTPVAIAGTGSGAVLVDADGRALGEAGDDALPVVDGSSAAPGDTLTKQQQTVVAVLAELPADLRSEIAEASSTDAGFELVLTDGIGVRWGDATQITAKADALQVLLEQADRPTIEDIDVSVPRATTLTRR